MSAADIIFWSIVSGGIVAFIFIVRSYVKGLDCPRDLWMLFATKVLEYTAYGAINMTFILWLSKDCGLGDIEAGAYISAWSIGLSVVAMLAGALCDSIGFRKTLLLSAFFLVFSRCFMFWMTDPTLLMIFGFIPLAIGFAVVGPVISVGIKRYTTKEGAAMGFGLFYVLMNVAFAAGGWFFDYMRDVFAEKDAMGKIINENAGAVVPYLDMHLSTYQLIQLCGLGFTIISVVFIFFLREGVEMTEDGVKITPPEKMEGNFFVSLWKVLKKGAHGTFEMISSVVKERIFWNFLFMLSLTLFVRFIFFHFHYTFPKYGIRVLGEGAKIGSIYGVLNPVLIVFLVPIVAYFTKKISSYKMLLIGSAISAGSCAIAIIPGEVFSGLTNSVLGELIFIRWLGMADTMSALMANPPTFNYWPLIFFISIFTIGEAVWSPRLMQFTAEIAPKGKEGTYIALSVLPYFAAKFVVGPMSGILVKYYTPLVDKMDAAGNVVLDSAGKAVQIVGDISSHHMIWVWIGGMAIVTPIGLVAFRKLFLSMGHDQDEVAPGEIAGPTMEAVDGEHEE